jgi:hypothetical protein
MHASRLYNANSTRPTSGTTVRCWMCSGHTAAMVYTATQYSGAQVWPDLLNRLTSKHDDLDEHSSMLHNMAHSGAC